MYTPARTAPAPKAEPTATKWVAGGGATRPMDWTDCISHDDPWQELKTNQSHFAILKAPSLMKGQT
jgi:hypothetical protein